MLLTDIFIYLASGELSQMSVGDMEDIRISEEDYPKVIPAINLATTELYKRFDLKMDSVTIQQEAHISKYTLHSKYAKTNTDSTEPIKFIHDSVYEPFTDNILVIEKVFDELGREIPLNEDIDYGETDAYLLHKPYLGANLDFEYQSVKTPAHNVVQVLPCPIQHNNLMIEYRAAPSLITMSTTLDPNDIEVEIPLSLLEPLLLYVGGRMYSNMQGNDPNAGAGYLARFEAACQRITELKLFNKNTVANTRPERNGWV